MKFKKILVAIDDNAYSMKAAQTAFALAHTLKATLGIIYVVDKSKEIINPDLGITPQQSETVLLNEAEKTIDQYTQMYDGVNHVFRFTPEGQPEQEIINISKEWEANVIVMGTHEKSTLTRIFTGSTAEYVIKHSEIPVLIIPAKMK